MPDESQSIYIVQQVC